MSRLINADALWMDIIHSMDYCDDILDIIERQPTIEERKTGRWTKAYDGNDGHVKCTGCFKTYDWISQAQYYNYCPNCGARMEEGDK